MKTILNLTDDGRKIFEKFYNALSDEDAAVMEEILTSEAHDNGSDSEEESDHIEDSSFGETSLTDLMTTLYQSKKPIIEDLLYGGTYIFTGAPKIGKSFFMAQLAYHVATGTPLWGKEVRSGEVLYLSLEDDEARLQGRLARMFGVKGVDNFHYAIKCNGLYDGLIDDLNDWARRHPYAKLIIIDTLQKAVGAGSDGYSYSNDYNMMGAVKQFSDSHPDIALVLVHHTRKMESSDPYNMISGTNGLFGSADGAVMLVREKRSKPDAVMTITGREIQEQELSLAFNNDTLLWELKETNSEPIKKVYDPVILKVVDFMKNIKSFTGTATQLKEAIGDTETLANYLSRKLNVNHSVLEDDFGICHIVNPTKSNVRTLTLINTKYTPEYEQEEITEYEDIPF